MTEAELQARIMLSIGALPGVRVFRNAVGEAWHGEVIEHSHGHLVMKFPRRVTYGLCPGSSDLIGLRSVRITDAMVGNTFAQFIAPEIKRPRGGHEREKQRDFIAMVQSLGGAADFVRSEQQAINLVTAA